MEGDSAPVATAFHGCRSEAGADLAPADAWSSSRASMARARFPTSAGLIRPGIPASPTADTPGSDAAAAAPGAALGVSFSPTGPKDVPRMRAGDGAKVGGMQRASTGTRPRKGILGHVAMPRLALGRRLGDAGIGLDLRLGGTDRAGSAPPCGSRGGTRRGPRAPDPRRSTISSGSPYRMSARRTGTGSMPSLGEHVLRAAPRVRC
jgi:hypothetical protein